MNNSPVSSNEPLRKTLTWLSAQTGFPRSRLETKAEILVCLAALAAQETKESQAEFLKSSLSYNRSALKAHAMNRSHAHYKSDNSAKT